MLHELGAAHVDLQPTNALALTALARYDPQAVVATLSGEGLDGPEFIRALRRSDLPCRGAAVIMVSHEATAAALHEARHAGAHEFLRTPCTTKDLLRRLDAAILGRRAWIEAVSYIGPDRRRFNAGDHAGSPKRPPEPPPSADERRFQALKILRSVIPAIDGDPVQAMRAMRAQVDELSEIAQATSDLKLSVAVGSLQRCLASANSSGRLWRPDMEASAQGLWAFLPKEADKPAAA
jgi:DNA-binding NarL/FixJ family response regulator